MMNFMKIWRLSHLKAAAFGAIAAGALLVGSPQVNAAAITLGSASTYGVLLGNSQTLAMGGGFKLNGNIGLGTSDAITVAGSNTITGNAYTDGSYAYSGSGSVSVSGGITTQSMATAISNAYSASTTAGALSANLSVAGNAISLTSGQSLTIKALTNLSENVLNISALSLTSGTLTFDDNGYTGAKFIINVTGNFTVGTSGSLKSLIQGINGASAADIIFNIEGTGNTVSLTGANSTSMIGTILAPSRNVTVGGNGTLTGALMAGVANAGKSYTLTDNSTGFNITDYAYKPSTGGGGGRAPEPSTIALLSAGLAGLAVVRRRRTARHK
jgi:fibronectin-binding autotransporter adhesin